MSPLLGNVVYAVVLAFNPSPYSLVFCVVFVPRVMFFVSVLQDGSVVEAGNHAELLSLGEHFNVTDREF